MLAQADEVMSYQELFKHSCYKIMLMLGFIDITAIREF